MATKTICDRVGCKNTADGHNGGPNWFRLTRGVGVSESHSVFCSAFCVAAHLVETNCYFTANTKIELERVIDAAREQIDTMERINDLTAQNIREATDPASPN